MQTLALVSKRILDLGRAEYLCDSFLLLFVRCSQYMHHLRVFNFPTFRAWKSRADGRNK